MSNDDDMLDEFDLSAWEAPPPPVDLADAVIDRMGGTDVGIAVPVEEHRVPKRGWIIGGVAVAVVVLVVGAWSLIRSTHHAAPASGRVVAEHARSLSLDTVHADLDAGADVRWKREGDELRVEQRTGKVTWHVDRDQKLVIDAGARLASVEATGANLRVEVQMNAMDARVIGASALTAAAVAMVTVVVYEGHVKVRDPNQQTVVVAPGTTYKVNATDDSAPTVGASVPQARHDNRVAILGLELLGAPGGDAPVVAQVLSASLRAVARKQGPFELGPGTDKDLVDEKLLANCANEAPPCMAAIGENLGVDKLIYGSLQRTSDKPGYSLALSLFDVSAKRVERAIVRTFDEDKAQGAGLDAYARQFYGDVVGASTVCDADVLKEEGMQHINMGQHAAALAKFEDSLACKQDPYVVQLAFMESCSSANSAKAKQYYKQLTAAQQSKFAVMCIRQKVAYRDDDDAVATSLTREDISKEMNRIKPDIYACAQKAKVGGKVVVAVHVNLDGEVQTVDAKEAPTAVLGNCVTAVVAKAKFKATTQGGAFTYPLILPAPKAAKNFDFKAAAPPANCDADALKEAGMENINMGQHAAALAKFEASLKCKSDPYVIQLAFMEACMSGNAEKAKLYYKRMTPAQQTKFGQICVRNKVDYQ
ncbi:MAG TPA: hypothetical protein VIV40_10915 [Kofleriaceae bacterium]